MSSDQPYPWDARVAHAFQLSSDSNYRSVGTGHIHGTWKVESAHGPLLLQQFNSHVFPDPRAVAENLQRATSQLSKQHAAGAYRQQVLRPVHPCPHPGNAPPHPFYVLDASACLWRAARWIEDSSPLASPPSPQQTTEAARAYGSFSRVLNEGSSPPSSYAVILDGFHDLAHRRAQFKRALRHNVAMRADLVPSEIDQTFRLLEAASKRIHLGSQQLPWRTTHNDSKLDNLLFDSTGGQVVAVVDLDTVMPGSPVIDFGDLVRSVCSSHAEDAPSEGLSFHEARFRQLVKGYLEGWAGMLLKSEQQRLADGALYVTTLVAARFLTDYLEGDRYFSVTRPEHNLDRARNQLRLADQILAQLPQLRAIADEAASSSGFTQ